MGQNRRYGTDVTDGAIDEFLLRPRPISLSPAELGEAPEEDFPEPRLVEAWVRFPETPLRVRGRAVRWTARAVLVEFELRGGATHRAWVWASAVASRSR